MNNDSKLSIADSRLIQMNQYKEKDGTITGNKFNQVISGTMVTLDGENKLMIGEIESNGTCHLLDEHNHIIDKTYSIDYLNSCVI